MCYAKVFMPSILCLTLNSDLETQQQNKMNMAYPHTASPVLQNDSS